MRKDECLSSEARLRLSSRLAQTFKVPEYGTRVEYPAGIFAAVGEAEKGVGQRFESDDGHARSLDRTKQFGDGGFIRGLCENRAGEQQHQGSSTAEKIRHRNLHHDAILIAADGLLSLRLFILRKQCLDHL
jgi:hypothetical protein